MIERHHRGGGAGQGDATELAEVFDFLSGRPDARISFRPPPHRLQPGTRVTRFVPKGPAIHRTHDGEVAGDTGPLPLPPGCSPSTRGRQPGGRRPRVPGFQPGLHRKSASRRNSIAPHRRPRTQRYQSAGGAIRPARRCALAKFRRMGADGALAAQMAIRQCGVSSGQAVGAAPRPSRTEYIALPSGCSEPGRRDPDSDLAARMGA